MLSEGFREFAFGDVSAAKSPDVEQILRIRFYFVGLLVVLKSLGVVASPPFNHTQVVDEGRAPGAGLKRILNNLPSLRLVPIMKEADARKVRCRNGVRMPCGNGLPPVR